MIIENNNNLFQLRTKDYHINIKHFLQKQSSLYTFNDFITPLKHHVITQRNIHYIKINYYLLLAFSLCKLYIDIFHCFLRKTFSNNHETQ